MINVNIYREKIALRSKSGSAGIAFKREMDRIVAAAGYGTLVVHTQICYVLQL